MADWHTLKALQLRYCSNDLPGWFRWSGFKKVEGIAFETQGQIAQAFCSAESHDSLRIHLSTRQLQPLQSWRMFYCNRTLMVTDRPPALKLYCCGLRHTDCLRQNVGCYSRNLLCSSSIDWVLSVSSLIADRWLKCPPEQQQFGLRISWNYALCMPA